MKFCKQNNPLKDSYGKEMMSVKIRTGNATCLIAKTLESFSWTFHSMSFGEICLEVLRLFSPILIGLS